MPRGRPKGSYKKDANIRHPLYKTWVGMRSRCNNPNNPLYKWYGARGICVAERWDIFINFANDMGQKPEPAWQWSLEREDNDGPYSKENCVWAIAETQQNNKTSNRKITHEGETMNLSQWAKKLDTPYNLLWSRVKRFGEKEALRRSKLIYDL